MRPAIRIIFAPLFRRDKAVREAGLYLHGKARGRTIWLDPRGGDDLIDTIVHEIAHANHPQWPERVVQAYTKKRLKKMSWKEKARYLKLLGSAILEGEE